MTHKLPDGGTDSEQTADTQNGLSDTETNAVLAPDHYTQFQLTLLRCVEKRSGERGQAIKCEIEDYYNRESPPSETVEVNHGRLYPNLDALVNRSVVEKGTLDKRTNSYTITPEGRTLLNRRFAFFAGEDASPTDRRR